MQLEAAFVRTALKSQSFGVLAFVLPEGALNLMTINQRLLTVHAGEQDRFLCSRESLR